MKDATGLLSAKRYIRIWEIDFDPMQTFTDGKKLFAEKNLDEKLAA